MGGKSVSDSYVRDVDRPVRKALPFVAPASSAQSPQHPSKLAAPHEDPEVLKLLGRLVRLLFAGFQSAILRHPGVAEASVDRPRDVMGDSMRIEHRVCALLMRSSAVVFIASPSWTLTATFELFV